MNNNYSIENEIKLINQIEYSSFPQDEIKTEFINFIKNNENDYYNRYNLNGHITGSMLVLNKDIDKVLLTHHKKLNKWLQLGGHNDSMHMTILETAVKEMFEEGFGDKEVEYKLISQFPIDLDIHGVGTHSHYDICYSCIIEDENLIECSDESYDLKWVSVKEVLNNDYDVRLQRMIENVLQYYKLNPSKFKIK